MTTNQETSPNYYPVSSAIAIYDINNMTALIVLNDRAQGGSVLETGRVEFM